MHLAGGTVHLDRPGISAQKLVNRLAGFFADDVPAGGFDPEVAPSQDACLLQQVLYTTDFLRIGAHQISAQKVSQAFPFHSHGGAGAVSFYSFVGGQFDQRETVVRLRVTGNPRWPERFFKRDRDVVKLNG